MDKHTPGPWERDGVEIYPVRGFRAQDAICSMSSGQDGDRLEANARLIAAAPELLEALIGVIKAADHFGYAADSALIQARAAVASAGLRWEIAPAWATHYGPESKTHVAGWYRIDELGVRGFCADAGPNKTQLSASYLDDWPAIETMEQRP